jgi:DNA-binding beta-propeller fold protein YncE
MRFSVFSKRAAFVCCFAAFCGLLTGCTETVDGPVLAVKSSAPKMLPPVDARMPAPRGMTFGPKGELYILDNAGRVIVFGSNGKIIKQWFMPEYSIGKPEGICIFKDGRIAVADTHYHQLVFFDQDGKVVGKHGSQGDQPGQFVYPVALTQDPNGFYYVCEYGGGDRVQKFDVEGNLILQFGGFGSEDGEFQRPSGIVWLNKKVYIADAINNRIQVFSDSGEFLEILGAPDSLPALHYPYDLAKTPDGNLMTVEYGACRITKLDLTGKILGRFGSPGTDSNQFITPWGLAINKQGNVFVADTGNRRFVELEF